MMEFFLFAAWSRPALGPTQPAIKWIPEALTPRVKRPLGEADHSPPSIAGVNSARSYISNHPTRPHGVVLN
jgi:hypothetical protein